MNAHVLLDKTFFATSVPVGDGQRLLPLPSGKGLAVGDTIFLRDESGTMTWVGNVLAAGETDSTDSWANDDGAERRRHAIVGYLARIHPDALPRGTSKLSARWVTLNRRTLPTTLPWWDDHLLVYHSTLRIVEGIFTAEQVQQAAGRGYMVQHPSGHWTVPHGEARKRIMVEILGIELVCGLCGGPIERIESATQDHIIPISQGGPDTLANVQLAHRACNELKGNALPEQYPPFFPQPGHQTSGWYSRTPSAARGGRGRGGPRRERRPGATGFQVETREVMPAGGARAPERTKAAQSGAKEVEAGKTETATAPETAPEPKRETRPAQAAAAKAKSGQRGGSERKSAGAKAEPAPVKTEPAAEEVGATEQTEAAAPVTAEEKAWLAAVQDADLKQLQQHAKEPNWAARTASLRTLEQLPRARAGKARAQGTLLAEANGPKGRFHLLLWEDNHVLVEERGRRLTVHLVQMCRSVSPEAYVSYLSRFGRTSPLAVVLALLPLWQKGTPDEHGRLTVEKGNVRFAITVTDDRIADCTQEPSLAVS